MSLSSHNPEGLEDAGRDTGLHSTLETQRTWVPMSVKKCSSNSSSSNRVDELAGKCIRLAGKSKASYAFCHLLLSGLTLEGNTFRMNLLTSNNLNKKTLHRCAYWLVLQLTLIQSSWQPRWTYPSGHCNGLKSQASPTGIWTLAPQLLVLLWEVVETVRHDTQLSGWIPGGRMWRL